jgi:hypothetical protein
VAETWRVVLVTGARSLATRPGAEHTAGLARAAGLTVRQEVWHG